MRDTLVAAVVSGVISGVLGGAVGAWSYRRSSIRQTSHGANSPNVASMEGGRSSAR
jgi:tetrahydromethanopterin S-methyltransferase subunit D